jgi:hypothetical protein
LVPERELLLAELLAREPLELVRLEDCFEFDLAVFVVAILAPPPPSGIHSQEW